MNRGLSDVKELLQTSSNVAADVSRLEALREVESLVAAMAPHSADADFILRRVRRMIDRVPSHD